MACYGIGSLVYRSVRLVVGAALHLALDRLRSAAVRSDACSSDRLRLLGVQVPVCCSGVRVSSDDDDVLLR